MVSRFSWKMPTSEVKNPCQVILGFPYFNFLGEAQCKKTPCVSTMKPLFRTSWNTFVSPSVWDITVFHHTVMTHTKKNTQEVPREYMLMYTDLNVYRLKWSLDSWVPLSNGQCPFEDKDIIIKRLNTHPTTRIPNSSVRPSVTQKRVAAQAQAGLRQHLSPLASLNRSG